MSNKTPIKLHRREVLEAVLETAVNAIIIIDENGMIHSFNTSAENMFGYKASEVVGKKVNILMPKRFAKKHDSYIKRYLKTKVPHIIGIGRELEAIKKDGTLFPAQLAVSEVKLKEGHLFTGLIKDITEEKAMIKKLDYLATHDEITNLLNYRAFNEKLKSFFPSSELGVLFLIDISNYADIKNSHGIYMSNLVLKYSAKKLTLYMRSDDPIVKKTEGDFIAHLSGATFAVLFVDEGLQAVNHADLIAKRLIEQLTNPLNIENQMIYPHISIGISDHSSAENYIELIRNADIALTLAKRESEDSHCYYAAEYKNQLMRTVALSQAIHSALEQDEFYLVYQPQYNAKTNSIIGIEVLLRWDSLSFGEVSPDEFISIAMREGLIDEIDRHTFTLACAQFSRWKKLGYTNDCRLSINILPSQLLIDQFEKFVENTLEINNLEPKELEFEFLETKLIGRIESILPTLQKISNLGVQLAIDDFGKGHSSLNRLANLPINALKIDRSFIFKIGEDESESIIKIILQLAKSLKLTVIAEGVETKEQLDFLMKLGCNYIQGYYLSKPLKAKEMTQLLSKHSS